MTTKILKYEKYYEFKTYADVVGSFLRFSCHVHFSIRQLFQVNVKRFAP